MGALEEVTEEDDAVDNDDADDADLDVGTCQLVGALDNEIV